MERRLEGSITRVQDELGAQMQQFMAILGRQHPIRLAPEFPSRKGIDYILQRNRVDRELEIQEEEINHGGREEGILGRGPGGPMNHQPQGFPMPRMEIPVFEGINPR